MPILHELYHLVTRWQVREASLDSIIPANKCGAEDQALKNTLSRRKHLSFGVKIDISRMSLGVFLPLQFFGIVSEG